MIGAAWALAAAVVAGGETMARDNVLGEWKTPEAGGSLVRLESCGQDLCGRVLSSPRLRAFPDQRDVLNKQAALRGRAVRGLLFLRLRATGPGRWGDGWAYDPNDGGTYHGAMELKPDGSLRLTGCAIAPFCKTQTWTRANSASEPINRAAK